VFATCTILATGEQGWLVPSQSVPGMHHVVSRSTSGSLQCDCYYSSQRGKVCAHRACVFLFLKGQPKAPPAPKVNTIMVCCAIGEHQDCHIDGCSCSCHKGNKNTPKPQPASSEASARPVAVSSPAAAPAPSATLKVAAPTAAPQGVLVAATAPNIGTSCQWAEGEWDSYQERRYWNS
jgi:hypothetical protein